MKCTTILRNIVDCGQAPYNDPTATQHDEGSGQSDATRALLRGKVSRIELRKKRLLSVW